MLVSKIVIFFCCDLNISGNYSRDRDCNITSLAEMRAVIGMLYLIGLQQSGHTNVIDLWASDGTGIPILRAAMSYRRFLFLLRCMRFDDKTTRVERRRTDKLAAIRFIYDQFIENSKRCYTPGAYLTIDEMLHAFRGRCDFLQFMSGKPAKIGVKMQALVDAITFYTWNLELYCGQHPEGPYKVSNSPAAIVKRLVQPIEQSNRNITFDNWYTSKDLAADMLTKGLTCLGTMKKNKREIPPEFLPSKTREVKSSLFGFQEDTMMVSFVPKRNKSVILMSTLHDQPDIDSSTNKPQMILDYNETKGGVDTVDKMCAAYSVSRTTRLWTQAVFYILLNIGGINSQVLFFATDPKNLCRRRIFLKNLALQLMKEHLLTRSKIPTLPKDTRFTLRTHLKLDEEAVQQPLTDRKRGKCKDCVNTNTTKRCDQCKSFTCAKHSTVQVICKNCELSEFNEEV